MGVTAQQFCLGGDLTRCNVDFPQNAAGVPGTRIVNALGGIQGLQF
jgi:hypothetical protein